MKKVLGLLAVLGAAAAGVAAYAKRQGRDVGEVAGEWAGKANDVAHQAGSQAKDLAGTAIDKGKSVAGLGQDSLDDAFSDVKDETVDLRDDLANKASLN